MRVKWQHEKEAWWWLWLHSDKRHKQCIPWNVTGGDDGDAGFVKDFDAVDDFEYDDGVLTLPICSDCSCTPVHLTQQAGTKTSDDVDSADDGNDHDGNDHDDDDDDDHNQDD